MPVLTILADLAIFAAGVIAALSWRKIKAWLAGEEAKVVTTAKAEAANVAADVAKKV